jgi:phosphate transport system substrate-binding protein
MCFLVMLLLLLPGMSFGQLSYEGSTSIAERLLPDLVEAWVAKSGRVFGEIRSTDSTQGLQAVLKGSAVLGGMSRFLTQEELQQAVVNRPIGYDAVVIYVARENPLVNLTLDQVRGIFLGNIRQWREVGGPDGDILLALKENPSEGGIYGQFREVVLAGQALASPALQFPGHREAIEYVAENMLGITMGALAFDQKKAKILSVDGVQPSRKSLNVGEYPLARPFVLVYREDPKNGDLNSFLEFVFSREGQRIVERHVIPVLEFE